MPLVDDLVEELEVTIKNEGTFNPEYFPQDVEWACGTYKDGSMINVLRAQDGEANPEFFIAVHAGDGGVLERWDRPERTLSAIKKRVGRTPEGWT